MCVDGGGDGRCSMNTRQTEQVRSHPGTSLPGESPSACSGLSAVPPRTPTSRNLSSRANPSCTAQRHL